MPDIGAPELLIIALIVLLLFGAQRLPKLGRSLGQGISSFKRGLNDDGSLDDEERPVVVAEAQTALAVEEHPVEAAPAEGTQSPESRASASGER